MPAAAERSAFSRSGGAARAAYSRRNAVMGLTVTARRVAALLFVSFVAAEFQARLPLASALDGPFRRNSSARISRCARNSSSGSRSVRDRRNKNANKVRADDMNERADDRNRMIPPAENANIQIRVLTRGTGRQSRKRSRGMAVTAMQQQHGRARPCDEGTSTPLPAGLSGPCRWRSPGGSSFPFLRGVAFGPPR